MNTIYPLFGFETDIIKPIQIGDGIVVSKTIIEVEKLNPVNLSNPTFAL